MIPPAWSLFPPLTVIILAFLYRKMNFAFLAGIIVAALMSTSGSLSQSALLALKRLQETALTVDNLYLYGFLILIGTLVIAFNRTGSITDLANLAAERLHTKVQAETTAIIFSLVLFIDDYLSILTVGHVIQPVIQRFGVPRVKLAYLIHSLAGVVVILAPLSSWVATISAQLYQSGVSLDETTKPFILADPFFIYLSTIPFLFYSFLTIASVLFIVRYQLSFGPMHDYEKKNTVIPGKKVHTQHPVAAILPVVVPIVTLVASMIIGILYSGNYWLFGGTHTLTQAIQSNNNPFCMMLSAAAAALITSLSMSILTKKLTLTKIPALFVDGGLLMKDAILMIFLSATLGTMLKSDVFTGNYLASLLLGSVPIALLPALFFVVSLICALATGSAWGTFSLMLSIVIPMLVAVTGEMHPVAPEALFILLPALGAVFSGAVCGDQISPISETTIMAATSCGTTPLEHTRTQIPYALPALCWTIIGFIIAGYTVHLGSALSATYALIVALSGCIITLKVLNKRRSDI
jgi:Na+/H+ antiporter NhaC